MGVFGITVIVLAVCCSIAGLTHLLIQALNQPGGMLSRAMEVVVVLAWAVIFLGMCGVSFVVCLALKTI
jgi:hypothetical protein